MEQEIFVHRLLKEIEMTAEENCTTYRQKASSPFAIKMKIE